MMISSVYFLIFSCYDVTFDDQNNPNYVSKDYFNLVGFIDVYTLLQQNCH